VLVEAAATADELGAVLDQLRERYDLS